jgi:3-oxoacyl-(acyl-carrier-protein) synthase
LNDPIELAAIEASVPNSPAGHPHLYSHKGALGHSLGAAGLVSIVLNCVAHRTGTIPPNVRTQNPLPAQYATIAKQMVQRPIHRSVAIAAGFGGAIACVGISSG